VDLKQYIESGIIESYVMGLASDTERAEFERLCKEYPELLTARRKFEEKLEGYASENAELPPPEVKAKVLEAIRIGGQNEDDRNRSGGGLLQVVAIAATLLLIAMSYLYFQTKQKNQDLSETNDRLKTSLDTTRNILQRIEGEQKDLMRNPNVTVVNMVGTQTAPKSSANVYWDSASSNVYLVVRNMPKLPNDQQYQLWALIDGKPKDLGVFDATDDKVILKMKNTQKAQAFAITIERRGGSPSPSLQKMQSLGKTLLSQ
jgi:anti-sigma-K factor RskA